MKIRRIYIDNFKSLIDLEIKKPNPFSVFVGPNGSGKSNIFEALQLATLSLRFAHTPDTYNKSLAEWVKIFGGNESIRPKLKIKNNDRLSISILDHYILVHGFDDKLHDDMPSTVEEANHPILDDLEIRLDFLRNCRRIFIGNQKANKIQNQGSEQLNSDASNLEVVLKKICADKNNKEEILEWLTLFVPGIKNFEIQDGLSKGKPSIAFFEDAISEELPKELISDGTTNILSLLAAVYQSSEPQLLLIEEPENGLHPFVIRQLVSFFRQQCEEKGHYIWLNTHSQALVAELTSEEIITVTKEKGITKVKQHQGEDIYNLTMDEAWLSNALGGGVPW